MAWEALTDKKGGALEEEREGPIQILGGGTGDEEQEIAEERQGVENPIVSCRLTQGL